MDLSELAFADASLMVDFAMLARRLRAEGHELLLRDARPHIGRLIEITGLTNLEGIRFERDAHADRRGVHGPWETHGSAPAVPPPAHASAEGFGPSDAGRMPGGLLVATAARRNGPRQGPQ